MSAASGRRLGDLVGRTAGEVRARLGPPDVEREVGGDRWLLYEEDGVRLRIRCRPAGSPDAGLPAAGPAKRRKAELRVASWTASLEEGRSTLREAAEPLGLWPACAPDGRARSADGPRLRRAVRVGSAVHSLTARVRGGRIDEITVFDEEPEWGGPSA